MTCNMSKEQLQLSFRTLSFERRHSLNKEKKVRRAKMEKGMEICLRDSRQSARKK